MFKITPDSIDLWKNGLTVDAGVVGGILVVLAVVAVLFLVGGQRDALGLVRSVFLARLVLKLFQNESSSFIFLE